MTVSKRNFVLVQIAGDEDPELVLQDVRDKISPRKACLVDVMIAQVQQAITKEVMESLDRDQLEALIYSKALEKLVDHLYRNRAVVDSRRENKRFGDTVFTHALTVLVDPAIVKK